MKLYSGDRVLTARGIVQLNGRNGGYPHVWIGLKVEKGKVIRNSCRLLEAHEVLAVDKGKGMLPVLPGIVKYNGV